MTKNPPRGTKKQLPAALVKRAEALAAKKRAALAERGREDVALIREKQAEIVGSFFDIGAALHRLSQPGVAEAMGFASFVDLVERELSMSIAKARDLVAIATGVRRADALRWGQEKSVALLELARATTDADSPATLSKKRRLALKSGRVIDVEAANAATIREAAREERAARQGKEKPRRGVTTSAEDRTIAARLQDALRALGETRARVVSVARAGAGADLRIDRLPAAALATLAKAVAAARKGT